MLTRLLIGAEKLFSGDACLGADCPQCGGFEERMIGYCHGSNGAIWIHAAQGDVLGLPDCLEA